MNTTPLLAKGRTVSTTTKKVDSSLKFEEITEEELYKDILEMGLDDPQGAIQRIKDITVKG